MTQMPADHHALLRRAEELGRRHGHETGHETREAAAAAATERPGRGDRLADRFAATVGSWPFIEIQSVVLLCWIVFNVRGGWGRWDPYPFILLNLALSFQAAYSAPIIMMSANRSATVGPPPGPGGPRPGPPGRSAGGGDCDPAARADRPDPAAAGRVRRAARPAARLGWASMRSQPPVPELTPPAA